MDIYSAKYYVGDAGVIKIEGENKNYNGERKTEENYIKTGEGSGRLPLPPGKNEARRCEGEISKCRIYTPALALKFIILILTSHHGCMRENTFPPMTLTDLATVCPRNFDPSHKVTYFIKWVKTSRTDGSKVLPREIWSTLFGHTVISVNFSSDSEESQEMDLQGTLFI